MPEYALILSLLLAVAFVLQKRFELRLYKSKKHLIVTNLCLLVIGVVWDHIAIARGHWSFGKQFLLGLHIGLMPIEEFGFILIMVYFSLVIFKLLEKQLQD